MNLCVREAAKPGTRYPRRPRGHPNGDPGDTFTLASRFCGHEQRGMEQIRMTSWRPFWVPKQRNDVHVGVLREINLFLM